MPDHEEVDPRTRQQLVDVVVRYATAIDRRDWALFRTCFADDCRADYGEIGAWHGVEEFTTFMEEIHSRCGVSMHRVGNHEVRVDGEGYEMRSAVDAVVMRGDDRKGIQTLGYYDDTFVLTMEGWKVASRRFVSRLAVRVVAHPET